MLVSFDCREQIKAGREKHPVRENEFLLFLLCAAVIGVPILACIIKYFADYAADLRYVKRRIAEADGWDEYVHWSHELRCLHWSILPGLTPHRVRRIAKRFGLLFYKPKHKGKKEARDGLFSMLAPSLAAICICCVCLVSVSYAWFTAGVESKSSTLTAASYKIDVSIKSGNDSVAAYNGVYSLKKENSYTVTLTASGTASTGYCVIKSGEETWYTDQISTKQTKTFTFTITPGADADFTFEAVWGTYSSEPSVKTCDNLNYPAAAEENNTNSYEETKPAETTNETTEKTSEEQTEPVAESTTETEQIEQEGGETPADTNAAATYEDTPASEATSEEQQQNGTQEDPPEDIASDTSTIK